MKYFSNKKIQKAVGALFLSLTLFVTCAPSLARAQANTDGGTGTSNPINNRNNQPLAANTPAAVNPTQLENDPQSGAQPAQEGGGNWLVDYLLSGLDGILSMILMFIAVQTSILVSLWLGIASILFDWVIQYTVVNMHDRVAEMSVTLNLAWGTFRDLANMFFIFILLYIAIGTILNLSRIQTKKMLVNVIIIGLLLNFSLFFTKIIIDLSNILATGFYNALIGTHTTIGIGGVFFEQMKILVGFKFENFLSTNSAHTFFVMFGGIILMAVAACVFFGVALIFIIRFIVLIFLMILSPLAFASMALPNDDYSSKWWHALLNQAIFAPVFMALAWVSIKILEGFVASHTGGSVLDVFDPQGKDIGAAMPVFFNFIVVIAMLLFSLFVARSLGATGASSLMKYADGARTWAQGKVGRSAVRTLGVGNRTISTFDRKWAESEFGKSRLGRTLRSATTGRATSWTFGDESVQQRDKQYDKEDKEYGKKALEKDKERRDAEIKLYRKNTVEAGKEGEKIVETKKAELREQIAQGNAIEVEKLEEAKKNLAERERIADKDDENEQEFLRKSREQIATTQKIVDDMKPHVGEGEGKDRKKGTIEKGREAASRLATSAELTDDEKRETKYNDKLEARAKQLENTLGTSVPVLKQVIAMIPADRVKEHLVKNYMFFNDAKQATKALRDEIKGKGNQNKKLKDKVAKIIDSGGNDDDDSDKDKGGGEGKKT